MHIESNRKRKTDTAGRELIIQTGEKRKKKERKKKKNFLRFFLRKMNLRCTSAFIRMSHAFFLLFLPDTVSYVQADCDTLSGHCIFLLPDGSLPTSVRDAVLRWQVWQDLWGLRMLVLLMVIRNHHLQQDSACLPFQSQEEGHKVRLM